MDVIQKLLEYVGEVNSSLFEGFKSLKLRLVAHWDDDIRRLHHHH